MMRERVFLSWGLMLLLHLDPVLSVCYFPGELQGTWATQETTSRESRISRSPISYQYVTIEPDTILEWGSCHARQHNDLILTDRSGNTRCFRCVRLNVISEKLVQVWTKDLSKCYISEEAATRNCPSVDTADSSTQIMLYKVKNSWGDRDVKEIECPLNGRFSFTYRRGNEIEGVPSARCDQPTSEFSNCPYGFGFDVLYNECASFTPSRTGLQCMGSWTGVNGEEYLAVWDTAVRDGDRLPMFKCGMFREEAGTGRVFLAFSEDSTCVNSLNSPTDGYETYVLTSLPSTPLPPAVQEAKCTFPLSLLGHWHHTYVADDTIVFKDYRNFKTYSARCVHDLGDGERYIVYARTHCGEWNYNCLWLKRRSANVLEFMMGLYPKETFDDRLCDQDKFGDLTAWTTQAKSLLEEPTTCPIVGNYVGELPDASGICAQLYSDCDAPQIMYYTVSECRNGVVVSERDEYIGPTSEAGPWLPPEQKVSTGAVLTIVDEDGGGRGRRQVGGGRSRARTTTISWLWGKGRTPATPTTTTTTTPSTTISSSNGRSSIQFHDSSADRNYNWRNTNPDPFLEDPRPPIISPGDSRVPPSRQNSYSPLGFWPDSRDQPGNEEPDTRVQRPYPPSFGAGRNSSDTNEDKGDGVPGRATWVPGAPPGFQSSSTQRAVATDSSHNFPHESVSQFPGSPVSPSSSHNVDNNRRLPAGDKHQILRQGTQEGVDDSAYAWDNRHKYPEGYWLTLSHKGDVTTKSNLRIDFVDKGSETDKGVGNLKGSRYGMTDGRSVHGLGGGTSQEEQVSSSWASWPDNWDGHDGNPLITSQSKFSGFDDPIDVSTAFSAGWKPSLDPTLPSSPSVPVSKDEFIDSSLRRPFVDISTGDSTKKVKDEIVEHDGQQETSLRQPVGRGYWSSAEESSRHIDRSSLGDTHLHVHSSRPTAQKPDTHIVYNSSIIANDNTVRSNVSAPSLVLDSLDFANRDFNYPVGGSSFQSTEYDKRLVDSPHIDSSLKSDKGLRGTYRDVVQSSWRSEFPVTSSGDDEFPGKIVGHSNLNRENQRRPGHDQGTTSFEGLTPTRRAEHFMLSKEREYQCLGEWEEEGRVYALTFRRDIKTYECFVGVIKPGGVVFIKEAGTVCSRGVQPEVLGMKLHRKEACSEPYISTSSSSSQASQTAQQENDRPRTTRPPWFHTTRPWKPITGRPRGRGSGSAGYQSLSQLLISMSLLITLMAIKTTAV